MSSWRLKYNHIDKLMKKKIWDIKDMIFLKSIYYQLCSDIENKAKAREIEEKAYEIWQKEN